MSKNNSGTPTKNPVINFFKTHSILSLIPIVFGLVLIVTLFLPYVTYSDGFVEGGDVLSKTFYGFTALFGGVVHIGGVNQQMDFDGNMHDVLPLKYLEFSGANANWLLMLAFALIFIAIFLFIRSEKKNKTTYIVSSALFLLAGLIFISHLQTFISLNSVAGTGSKYITIGGTQREVVVIDRETGIKIHGDLATYMHMGIGNIIAIVVAFAGMIYSAVFAFLKIKKPDLEEAGKSTKFVVSEVGRFIKENYSPLVFISRIGEFFQDFVRWTRKHKVASLVVIFVFSIIAALVGGAFAYTPYKTKYMHGTPYLQASGLILAIVLGVLLVYWIVTAVLTKTKEKVTGELGIVRNIKGWMYVMPALIPMTVFTFYPMISAVLMGFVKFGEGTINFNYLDWDLFKFFYYLFTQPQVFIREHITISHFVNTFADSAFYHSLITTTIIVLVSVPISTAISVFIAVFLNSIKKLQGLYQTVYFLPYVTAMTAVTAVWRLILAYDSSMYAETTYGIFNSVIVLFGGSPVNWLSSPDPLFKIPLGGLAPYEVYPQMIAFIIYSIWSGLAFKIIIFLTGLQGIDKQVYQAAQIDGASKKRIFFKITIPLLAPILLFNTTTSMIGAFKTYTSTKTLFLNAPKFETIVFYLFKFIDYGSYDRASAVADVLFIILMCFTAIRNFTTKHGKVKNNNGPLQDKKKKMKRADRILAGGKN